MTKNKVYLLLQTLVCILLVVMLSTTAVTIFREGKERQAADPREHIYTREIAAEKFAPIAPLFFISIGLLLSGLVLEIRDEKADSPVRDAEINRNLIAARVAHPSDAMRREQGRQKKLLVGGWCIFFLCMCPIAWYMKESAHFPSDLESMFASLMRVFLPWTALGLAVLIVTCRLREKSLLRETEAAQAQMKAERAEGIRPEPVFPKASGRTGVIRAVLIIAAIVFIIMGIFNLSARDVLNKAITICTECVGLG